MRHFLPAFIIISFWLITGCKKNEVVKDLPPHPPTPLKAEANKTSSIKEADAATPNTYALYLDKMPGNWEYEGNDNEHSFSLTISKENNNMYVDFCFVKGRNGDYIDCPEEKVAMKYTNGILTAELISGFEENPIVADFSMTANDKLVLRTSTEIIYSFFSKEMVFTRYKG